MSSPSPPGSQRLSRCACDTWVEQSAHLMRTPWRQTATKSAPQETKRGRHEHAAATPGRRRLCAGRPRTRGRLPLRGASRRVRDVRRTALGLHLGRRFAGRTRRARAGRGLCEPAPARPADRRGRGATASEPQTPASAGGRGRRADRGAAGGGGRPPGRRLGTGRSAGRGERRQNGRHRVRGTAGPAVGHRGLAASVPSQRAAHLLAGRRRQERHRTPGPQLGGAGGRLRDRGVTRARGAAGHRGRYGSAERRDRPLGGPRGRRAAAGHARG